MDSPWQGVWFKKTDSVGTSQGMMQTQTKRVTSGALCMSQKTEPHLRRSGAPLGWAQTLASVERVGRKGQTRGQAGGRGFREGSQCPAVPEATIQAPLEERPATRACLSPWAAFAGGPLIQA